MLKNPESISGKCSFGKIMGNYLIAHGFPLLANKNGLYYFTSNKELDNFLSSMPIWMKIFRDLYL